MSTTDNTELAVCFYEQALNAGQSEEAAARAARGWRPTTGRLKPAE